MLDGNNTPSGSNPGGVLLFPGDCVMCLLDQHMLALGGWKSVSCYGSRSLVSLLFDNDYNSV
jgi:hypothetical protein